MTEPTQHENVAEPSASEVFARGSACLPLLRAARPAVLPSLLLCDFGHLDDEVARLEEAGVPALHLDVMDGHFVPNFTYGMPIVEAVRRLTAMPLDVHLMMDCPERFLEAFRQAGADVLTVHAEAVSRPVEVLRAIRDLGAGAGLAFNPSTPLDVLDECIDYVDVILIMSVNAGFGGQTFQPVALERLSWVRRRYGPDVLVEVDGGVNAQNIKECATAGADMFVVGSAIFRNHDYKSAVDELTTLVSAAAGHSRR